MPRWRGSSATWAAMSRVAGAAASFHERRSVTSFLSLPSPWTASQLSVQSRCRIGPSTVWLEARLAATLASASRNRPSRSATMPDTTWSAMTSASRTKTIATILPSSGKRGVGTEKGMSGSGET